MRLFPVLTSGSTQDRRVGKDCFIFTSCLLHSSCKYVSCTDKFVRKLTTLLSCCPNARLSEQFRNVNSKTWLLGWLTENCPTSRDFFKLPSLCHSITKDSPSHSLGFLVCFCSVFYLFVEGFEILLSSTFTYLACWDFLVFCSLEEWAMGTASLYREHYKEAS